MDPTPQNDKQQALEQIDALMKQHGVTAEDLQVKSRSQAVTTETPPTQSMAKKNLSVAETLYNVGAIVMIVGAWAFVGINWAGLGDFGKVAVSLLVVASTYLCAIGLSKVKLLETVAPALYLSTIATIPVVVIAVVESLKIGIEGAGMALTVAIVSGACAVAGWFIHRFPLFTLAAIVYATLGYIAVVQLVIDASSFNREALPHVMVGAYVALGLIYCLLAAASSKLKPLVVFKSALYGVGSLFIFLPLFTETGWSSQTVTVMGIMYPVIIAAGVVASALLKQSSILAVATIFLIIYLIKTTFLYFSDNIGWPSALILSGLLTVAVGIGVSVLAKKLGFGLKKNKS